MSPPGLMKRYYFFEGKNEQEIQQNKNKKLEIINDGVKNTFAFGPMLIVDGKRYYNQGNVKAERQGFCQIDKNNIIIFSTTMQSDKHRLEKGLEVDELTTIMGDYGCINGFNFDGGGSEVYYYKKNNNEYNNEFLYS